MALQTQKLYPDGSLAVAGYGNFAGVPISGPTQLWQNVKTGANPPTGDMIYTLADNVATDLRVRQVGELPEWVYEGTRIVVSMRIQTFNTGDVPGLQLELWTDYPSDLARQLAGAPFNVDTGFAQVVWSFPFVLAVTASKLELQKVRVRPITLKNSGAPPPSPYEEPGD